VYLTLGTLVAAAWAVSGGAAPLPKPTPEQIAHWVQQLGDNDFAAREQASRKLWAAGEPAEAALREAARSDDAEVARRARDILDKFKVGIYPDTPKDVVELLVNYQAADAGRKGEIVRKLAEGGAASQKALRKIVSSEDNEELKNLIFGTVARQLPLLLAADNREDLEPLLEAGLYVSNMGPGPYAAYWLLRGKLDERIASLESRAKGPDPKKVAEVLASLYRARGDLVAARRAAEAAERQDLVEALLYEAADWKELARLPDLTNAAHPVEKAGFRAAFHRLAGNGKDFEAALDELRKLAEAKPGQENQENTFYCAKALFLNDRAAEALELLAHGGRPAVRFEILCTQHKYADALALVEQARSVVAKEELRTPEDPEARKRAQENLRILEELEARTLYILGERDKAQAIFARRAAEIKEGAEAAAFEGLLDAEYRAGLKVQALEHCARLLEVLEPKNALANLVARPLLAKVFPDKTDAAVVWWVLLRQKSSTEGTARLLRRLRDLIDGRSPSGEVKALVEEAERAPALRAEEEALRPAALAEVAHAAGLDELARSCLEKAASPPPAPGPLTEAEEEERRRKIATALLRLGDLLAKRKQWERAADHYRQAWDKDRREPLPLFLAGWALDKGGQAAEGRKLMEKSHWLPLGDEASRYTFLQDLGRRGHPEAARREADLLRRVGRPAGFYLGGALRRQALDAAARKDYRTAATDYELAMLLCIHPSTSFVQPGAYVGVPALVHRFRAAGELTAGKIDAARREIALSRTDLPGGIDLATQLVPLLERGGHKKDADQLFADTLAVYENLCRDYPKCAWAHNSAAWLSACCRRNLDGALAHANKAVELAPDNAGHLDTLAEVLFQRGDKDRAVATQKRAIELDPKKPYFRKQLRRLEAGDPTAERPTEDEE
jgi:tetratricopeptide (TPR) repeat protein